MNKILIVEDEFSISNFMKTVLEGDGYTVEVATCAAQARAALEKMEFSAMLLDLGLPDADGLELLRELRQRYGLPVIVVSARTEESEKVAALDSGADDYITKPFGVLELTARIRNLFKRTQKHTEEQLSVRDIVLDKRCHEVHKAGAKIELTLKEFDLLALLMENAPNVVKRDELLNQVWGYDFIGETRTLDMHIRTLRQKLSDDSDTPGYISTVRGVGYKFVSDEEH